MKSSVSHGGCLCLHLSFRKSVLLFCVLFFFVGMQFKLYLLICKACATPTLHEHLITLREIQIICETFSNVFCMCNNFSLAFRKLDSKIKQYCLKQKDAFFFSKRHVVIRYLTCFRVKKIHHYKHWGKMCFNLQRLFKIKQRVCITWKSICLTFQYSYGTAILKMTQNCLF